MGRYIATRLLATAPVLLTTLVLIFLITHVMPGDPIQAMMGQYPVPPGYRAIITHEYGLDQPLAVQLWLYLVNLVHGNLGYSFANHQPVLPLVLARARYTLLLMIPSLVIASAVGVILGIVAAPREGKRVDTTVTVVSVAGVSIPVFWLAQLLVVVFAVQLGILPSTGIGSVRVQQTGLAGFADYLAHLVLPCTCLVVSYLAIVARVARASTIEALGQDYVLTALAKGTSATRVLWTHVLPNALIPVVTVIGVQFGFALTGAVLTETVFGWPGIGSLFISSVANRDYPVLEAIFLLAALSVIIANLATDLLYGVLDPRIRRSAHA